MPKPNRFARTTADDVSRHFKNKRFIYRLEAQHQSKLFELPLEIREQIYRFVLPRSHRISKSSRRDERGFEEEWGRTQYTANCQWQEYQHFPLCWWTPGDMVLLRLCRRITSEATPLFFKNNMFDMAISGDEPQLKIAYFPSPMPSSRCLFPNFTTYGGTRWSKGTKKLSTVKRDYVRLVRCWNLLVHTHYAGQGKDWREAAEQIADDWEDERQRLQHGMVLMLPEQHVHALAWFRQYCAGLSYQRRIHRNSVVQGLRKWIAVVEESQSSLRQLAISFEPYPDYKGMGWTTDGKLVQAVRGTLPAWMHDKLFLLGGKISSYELEAWEID